MNRAGAIAAYLSTAQEFVGVKELPSNRGIVPDFANWLHSGGDWREYPLGLLGAPWCATSANLIGRLALGILWPLPRTPAVSAVDGIVRWGIEAKVIAEDGPQPGDLLCIARQAGFGHVAIVREVLPLGEVGTVEGNSNDDGSFNGDGVYALTRRVKAADVLVRWVLRFPESVMRTAGGPE
jgi:hypothetical protein